MKMALDDASGSPVATNFEILNWVFERKVGPKELQEILHALSADGSGSLVKWTSIVLMRVAALMEVTNCTSESLSLNDMLPRLMTIVTRALDADRSTLFLHDAQTGELFSRVAQGGEVSEIRISSTQGIAGTVFSEGEALTIDDAYSDDRFNPDVDKRTGYKTQTILCSPLRKKTGEIIGVSQALNKNGGRFSPDDLSLMEAMTRQAAAALETAQLLEQVERAQREEAQLLEFFTEISSELQLDLLLAKIVKVATSFLNADRGTLFLYDPNTNELWSRVAEGEDSRDIRVSIDDGIAGACFQSGETLHIADAYDDDRFNRDVDRKTGYRTRNILCMPIINKHGKAIGVMQVLNKKTGPFLPTDERRLKAFCAQGAIALENSQLFEEVLTIKNYNESVLKSLSNGVLTLNAKDQIARINDAAARILEVDAEELLGKNISELFEATNPWMLSSLESVKKRGEPDLRADTDVLLQDGTEISVNLTIAPLTDAKEKSIGSMFIFEDISREKRMKSTMSRYMDKEVADKLLEGGEAALGGQLQEATVLFTDIRSFTTIAERVGAKETVLMLNEYFTDMVDVIFGHYGILDKYIGDAIMAVFGAPFSTPVDANNAVRAANQMIRSLNAFNTRRGQDGKEAISMGVGISTGEVIAGNIGSLKRMDYTVIGDSVNLAARLESANKQYGTQILLSEFTRAGVTDDQVLREIDLITVKGSHQPVSIYEALDYHTEETFPNRAQVLETFEEGMRYYRSRQWSRGLECFTSALDLNPKDSVSRIYADRCRQCIQEPMAPDWDGVWRMTEK